jgi:hypothetical protein
MRGRESPRPIHFTDWNRVDWRSSISMSWAVVRRTAGVTRSVASIRVVIRSEPTSEIRNNRRCTSSSVSSMYEKTAKSK